MRTRGWEYAVLTQGSLLLRPGLRSLSPNTSVSDGDMVKVREVFDLLEAEQRALPHGPERLELSEQAGILRARVFDDDVARVCDVDFDLLDDFSCEAARLEYGFDLALRRDGRLRPFSRVLPGESLEEYSLRRGVWCVYAVLLFERLFERDDVPGFWWDASPSDEPDALRFAREQRALLARLDPETPIAVYHVST